MKKTTTLLVLMSLVLVVACKSELDGQTAAVVSEAEAAVEEETEEAVEARELTIVLEDSSIGWLGAKVTGDHTGGFNKWDGTARVVDGELRNLNFTVDTRSIFSDNDRLTGHLMSDDFFDVENYPEASFVSTRIVEKAGEKSTHEVTGNFTIRGVTKSVTFPATVKVENDELHASSQFTIDRFDFGIEFAGMPDDLIRREVLMKVDLVGR